MSTKPLLYRKKPVVILAMGPLTNDNVLDIDAWCRAEKWYADPAELVIRTLEGKMKAREGDYIIRGVHGEFYPCKPDIFAATYERAEQTEGA